jgi:DNA-binding MarR family transcriptional regulator
MTYLDKQLCVQLYIKTRAVIRFHERSLKSLGLTYPKALVLLALEENESCYIDEIATCLLLNIGTLSPLLKKMATEGYIERKRDEKDERRVFVILTSQGKQNLEPIKEIFEKTAIATRLPSSIKEEILERLKLIQLVN